MKNYVKVSGLVAGLYAVSYLLHLEISWWVPPTALAIMAGMAYLWVSLLCDDTNSEGVDMLDVIRTAVYKGAVVSFSRTGQTYMVKVAMQGVKAPYVIESTRLHTLCVELDKCLKKLR